MLFALALATIALPTRASAQDHMMIRPAESLGSATLRVQFRSSPPAKQIGWSGPESAPDHGRPALGGPELARRIATGIGGDPPGGEYRLLFSESRRRYGAASAYLRIGQRHRAPPGDNDDFEIDTPNLAFTVFQPGHFRVEASADGTTRSSACAKAKASHRQRPDLRRARRTERHFTGTESLNADVEQIGGPDEFDAWSEGAIIATTFRARRKYLSHDVVGYEDLDDYGDWRDDSNYGHVWFPNRVAVGWAPYHTGHWAWIDPWGYTWVDDSPWGYAPSTMAAG